jgi:YHS domain-containing protein
MLNRRYVLRWTTVALLFGMTATGRLLRAQDTDQANLPRLAIMGYDPVAYFTDGRPTLGKPEFEYAWEEVRYHFASEQHMTMFRADPDRYAPQYDGSCTGAIALGLKIEANPENWLISDGRLFLFAGEAPASVTADQVAAADRNWQLLKDAPFGTDLRE